MKYTVRIEGKPEPVKVEAERNYLAAQIAVELHDNEMDGALSAGDGGFVMVTVSGDIYENVDFRVACGTEPFYRARTPLDPALSARMAEVRKAQAAATPHADVPEVTT